MDPDHALIRYGRGDQAFAISPQVFEPDEHGRSYRFRPEHASVWLRQITIRGGPFMMFQVLDTPQHRAAAARAGAIVDEGSIQNTNSWGLRGAEPDPDGGGAGDRPGRLVHAGDVQRRRRHSAGPPRALSPRRVEAARSRSSTPAISATRPSSITTRSCEYGERFRPHFVVVSVCPNDFGDGPAVMSGEGDWMDEAEYWLDKIQALVPGPLRASACSSLSRFSVRSRSIRQEQFYPGQIAASCAVHPLALLFPSRPVHRRESAAGRPGHAGGEADGPAAGSTIARSTTTTSLRSGAALWAEIVGQRLIRIFDVGDARSRRGRQGPRGSAQGAKTARAPSMTRSHWNAGPGSTLFV